MTVGSPLKNIFFFAMPILLGNLFQQLYGFVDTVIVGRAIDGDALLAVGCTTSMTFLILGFVMGITSGFSVITAQFFGKNNTEGVKRSIATSFILCGFFAVILTLISVFCAMPILKLLRTQAHVIDDAYKYVLVIYLGTPIAMFYNILNTTIRALGDSKTPLYFLILAVIINVGLDLLFIMVFKWGVVGAGLATVIAQLISAVLCFFYMLKKYKEYMPSKSDFKLDYKFMWEHLKVALPMGLQMSIMTIGIMVLQGVLNTYPAEVATGYVTANKIDQIAMQPMSSIGFAMATYVAQNWGAKRLDRIKQGVKASIVLTICFSLVSFLVVAVLGKYLIPLFMTEDTPNMNKAEVIRVGAQFLQISGAFYPILGILFLFRNTLQGMAKPVMPFISCIVELGARMGASIGFSAWFGFIGVCFATPSAWASAGIILLISYIVITLRFRKHPPFKVALSNGGELDIEGSAEAIVNGKDKNLDINKFTFEYTEGENPNDINTDYGDMTTGGNSPF